MDAGPWYLFGRVEIGFRVCSLLRNCCTSEGRCVRTFDVTEAPSLSVEESTGGCRWPDWNGSDSERTDPVSEAENIVDPVSTLAVADELNLARASTNDISIDDTAGATILIHRYAIGGF